MIEVPLSTSSFSYPSRVKIVTVNMRISLLPLLAAAAIDLVASAAVPASHVVHERREVPSPRYTKRSRVEPHIKLPVRIGLKQDSEALEHAQRWLMDVSHPASENFGRHW